MNIENFAKQFVEGYLFHDLENMAAITVVPPATDGGAGYPMVSTTLAGMELLGNLLTANTNPYNHSNANDYFLCFWNDYLEKQNSIYTNLGEGFRQLARNGIAHNFVAKPGVFVEKGSGLPLRVDLPVKEIYIDCILFFEDFKTTYYNYVQPIIFGTPSPLSGYVPLTTKANMQTRLDNLNVANTKDTNKIFKPLNPTNIIALSTRATKTMALGKSAPPSASSISHSMPFSGVPMTSTNTFTSSTPASGGTASMPPASTTIPLARKKI